MSRWTARGAAVPGNERNPRPKAGVWLLGLAAVAVLVVGCASPPSVRCEVPSRAVVDHIARGLTVTGGGSIGSAAAVRSSDYERVWMVAAEIDGPGMEGKGDVGVWATNDLTSPGLVMSVDAMARQFSDFPDGSTTSARTSTTDHGVREARQCLP